MNQSVESRSKELSRKMGFGCLIWSVLFFFNPCINIVDILPDFFGCVLLIRGLSKMADICPAISDAVSGLGRLRIVLLIKLLAVILVPLVDSTYVLVFTLSAVTLEFIYLLPAIGRIFDGFEYLGTRYDGNAVFGYRYKTSNGKIGIVKSSTVKSLTMIFFIVKGILNVAPELCVLSDYEYSGYVVSGVQINIADYKYPFLAIGMFITLVIGIIWMYYMISYLKHISRETPFIERLSEEYDRKIASNDKLLFTRAMSLSFSLIVAGFVFFANFKFDGVNIIPTFIGAILLTAAAINLKKYMNTRSAITVCAAFSAVSAVSFAFDTYLFGTHGEAAATVEKLAEQYRIHLGISAVEYILMLASVILILNIVSRIVKDHLSYDADKHDPRLEKIIEAQQKEYRRKLIVCLVLFIVITCGFAAVLTVAASYWLILFIAVIAWTVYVKRVLDSIKSEIEYKYM